MEAALGAPPLSQISAAQREELRGEVEAAEAFEDLPGKWQAAVLAAEGGEEEASRCCH